MAIKVLDRHTAELIAAGEVVERPASAVKELVENAVDAGSSKITVEIEGGGVACIRVSDNGCGIDKEDLPLAFLRHATSKLAAADDLNALSTLGFRGEALASIGSVAKVTVLTKSDAGQEAAAITMQGGVCGEVYPAARGRGTTIEVRELFYNVPARMKFLKKDTSEAAVVTEAVNQLALSNTGVAFRYLRDGKEVFATAGDKDLRAAAWQVLGKEFARELIPLHEASGPYTVNGLVCAPGAGRASRAMQLFFVNGRTVKNRTMMASLEQAYRGLSMQGRFPVGLLFLQMPPDMVDVNIHPAKTEVRFAHEQEVFGAVYRAVKAALLDAAGHSRSLELRAVSGEGPAGTGVGVPIQVKEGAAGAPPVYPAPPEKPFPAALYSPKSPILYQTSLEPPQSSPLPQTGGGPDIWPGEDEDTGGAYPKQQARPQDAFKFGGEPENSSRLYQEQPPLLRLVGEVFDTYIIAQAKDAVCLIDKHAAHERLIYEKLVAARAAPDIQLLLTPVTVSLPPADKDALLDSTEVLAGCGIQAEDFGGASVLVRGVPSDIETHDIPALVAETARRLSVNSRDTLNSKTEWVLHSIACRAAVKAGQHTPPAALLRLAQDILFGGAPLFCPHGRPVVFKITEKELERQFGRL